LQIKQPDLEKQFNQLRDEEKSEFPVAVRYTDEDQAPFMAVFI
jgi:hypothetical protein